MLEACGWAKVDAVALLMGYPLASLAREVGLPPIARELAGTRITGWLSTDRVADLNSKLSLTVDKTDNAVRAVVKATAAYWTQHEAEKATKEVLEDVRRMLGRAKNEGKPLRVAYDFLAHEVAVRCGKISLTSALVLAVRNWLRSSMGTFEPAMGSVRPGFAPIQAFSYIWVRVGSSAAFIRGAPELQARAQRGPGRCGRGR